MAISEKFCWEALKLAQNQTVESSWLRGKDSTDPPLQHAIPLVRLEYELVLRYNKDQIENGIYFLEKRGYFVKHGFPGLTRVVMRLSDRALAALAAGSFAPEEQAVFNDDVFQIKPSLYGMGFNPKELVRRLKKWGSARLSRSLTEPGK